MKNLTLIENTSLDQYYQYFSPYKASSILAIFYLLNVFYISKIVSSIHYVYQEVTVHICGKFTTDYYYIWH